MPEMVALLSSHVWEPMAEPLERLADRAGDVGVGAQDKRNARAQALVKLPRDRSGNLLPVSILAHEKLASDFARLLELSVNEVLLTRLGPVWADLEGSWASLHVLVPEPFMRLEELKHVPWEGSDDELLDVKAAAALLTVAPSTLTYWARERRVPCIRLGPRATRWTRPLLRQIRDERLDRGRDGERF